MQDQLEEEDVTGEFTPEEDQCYKTCYDLLRTFVENRRRASTTFGQKLSFARQSDED